jgi:hypothetical protein
MDMIPNWTPTMKRFCKICGEKFMPTGKASRMCEDCIKKRKKKFNEKRFGNRNAKGKKTRSKKKM